MCAGNEKCRDNDGTASKPSDEYKTHAQLSLRWDCRFPGLPVRSLSE
jgi:hypothetical protein